MISQEPGAKFGPAETRDLSLAHTPDGPYPGKGRGGSGLRVYMSLGFEGLKALRRSSCVVWYGFANVTWTLKV